MLIVKLDVEDHLTRPKVSLELRLIAYRLGVLLPQYVSALQMIHEPTADTDAIFGEMRNDYLPSG